MCEGMGTACHPCKYPAPRTRQPLPAISSHGGAPGPLTNSGLMDAEHADKRGAVASARAPRVQVQDVCCEAARRPRPIRVFSVRPFCICAESCLRCRVPHRRRAGRSLARGADAAATRRIPVFECPASVRRGLHASAAYAGTGLNDHLLQPIPQCIGDRLYSGRRDLWDATLRPLGLRCACCDGESKQARKRQGRHDLKNLSDARHWKTSLSTNAILRRSD